MEYDNNVPEYYGVSDDEHQEPVPSPPVLKHLPFTSNSQDVIDQLLLVEAIVLVVTVETRVWSREDDWVKWRRESSRRCGKDERSLLLWHHDASRFVGFCHSLRTCLNTVSDSRRVRTPRLQVVHVLGVPNSIPVQEISHFLQPVLRVGIDNAPSYFDGVIWAVMDEAFSLTVPALGQFVHRSNDGTPLEFKREVMPFIKRRHTCVSAVSCLVGRMLWRSFIPGFAFEPTLDKPQTAHHVLKSVGDNCRGKLLSGHRCHFEMLGRAELSAAQAVEEFKNARADQALVLEGVHPSVSWECVFLRAQ